MNSNDLNESMMNLHKPGDNILGTVKRASRALAYSSAYYVAYGTVYGAAVITDLFPKDNVFAYGFADGANAARRANAARQEEAKHDTTGQDLEMVPSSD
ncbi:MAG: hypothetical protein GKR94_11790 [Gammaproteobacteria bacterium]|nr:hypothetical protein [Gammaproteobacteria bacterium]